MKVVVSSARNRIFGPKIPDFRFVSMRFWGDSGPFGPENGILGQNPGISKWQFLELENESEGRVGAEYGGFRGVEHESGPLRVQVSRESRRSRNLQSLDVYITNVRPSR